MTPAPSSFLDQYIPFLLVRADELISRPLLDDVKRRGFSVPEWRILAVLSDGVSLHVGHLAELAVLPQSTVSRSVDRLVERNLVRREDSSEDRRHTIVVITTRGSKAAAAILDAARNRQAEVLRVLSDKQAADLEKILRTLVHRLDGAAE